MQRKETGDVDVLRALLHSAGEQARLLGEWDAEMAINLAMESLPEDGTAGRSNALSPRRRTLQERW